MVIITSLSHPIRQRSTIVSTDDKKDLSQQVSTAKVGDKLVLKNLHFYNRSGIFVPESRPILEELLKIMLANPNLKISKLTPLAI